jgi:acetolactate synthase-1/2/3 large subunit
MPRATTSVLLAAGTPLTGTGNIASRNRPIHWGQEAFDQGHAAEYVKWDYELRGGQPVDAVVDRARIARGARRPVYLTLPRESSPRRQAAPQPDVARDAGADRRAAIEEATRIIAEASFMIVT